MNLFANFGKFISFFFFWWINLSKVIRRIDSKEVFFTRKLIIQFQMSILIIYVQLYSIFEKKNEFKLKSNKKRFLWIWNICVTFKFMTHISTIPHHADKFLKSWYLVSLNLHTHIYTWKLENYRQVEIIEVDCS